VINRLGDLLLAIWSCLGGIWENRELLLLFLPTWAWTIWGEEGPGVALASAVELGGSVLLGVLRAGFVLRRHGWRRAVLTGLVVCFLWLLCFALLNFWFTLMQVRRMVQRMG
jgi:hypothetical protein